MRVHFCSGEYLRPLKNGEIDWTQVSGILGFSVLILLDVKIDYRDGLVDFIYDEKRLR